MADRGQIVGGLLDGPLAFDNAIDPEAARIKGIRSEVAGRAQILVVPNLEAGNMLAKNLIFLAKADAAGLVLGARVPVSLTSRANSVRSLQAELAARAPYTPDAAQSAERSFVAAALPAAPVRSGLPAWQPWPALAAQALRAARSAQRVLSDRLPAAVAQLEAQRVVAPSAHRSRGLRRSGRRWSCKGWPRARSWNYKFRRSCRRRCGNLRRGTVAAGAAGETAGLVSTGGAGGGASAAAGPCCLLMMAFKASPGLEILERSILVLISSASARDGREDRLEVCAALRHGGGHGLFPLHGLRENWNGSSSR